MKVALECPVITVGGTNGKGSVCAVLEVGLGGRLDAVNLIDADCAVLTSIGIDHVDYLGPDRESIGREKAGIFRPGRPAVIAEPAPPRTVLAAPGVHYRLGCDFGY